MFAITPNRKVCKSPTCQNTDPTNVFRKRVENPQNTKNFGREFTVCGGCDGFLAWLSPVVNQDIPLRQTGFVPASSIIQTQQPSYVPRPYVNPLAPPPRDPAPAPAHYLAMLYHMKKLIDDFIEDHEKENKTPEGDMIDK